MLASSSLILQNEREDACIKCTLLHVRKNEVLNQSDTQISNMYWMQNSICIKNFNDISAGIFKFKFV